MPTARPLNAVQARPDLDRSIGLDRVDLIGSAWEGSFRPTYITYMIYTRLFAQKYK